MVTFCRPDNNYTCNTLYGRIKGNFCATNMMLHSKPLLWNAVRAVSILSSATSTVCCTAILHLSSRIFSKLKFSQKLQNLQKFSPLKILGYTGITS